MNADLEYLAAAFYAFDKWPTYGLAHDMLKDGRCQMADIERAGALIGIEAWVIQMRMHDMDMMEAS